jgi:hypothetical protein
VSQSSQKKNEILSLTTQVAGGTHRYQSGRVSWQSIHLIQSAIPSASARISFVFSGMICNNMLAARSKVLASLIGNQQSTIGNGMVPPQ